MWNLAKGVCKGYSVLGHGVYVGGRVLEITIRGHMISSECVYGEYHDIAVYTGIAFLGFSEQEIRYGKTCCQDKKCDERYG